MQCRERAGGRVCRDHSAEVTGRGEARDGNWDVGWWEGGWERAARPSSAGVAAALNRPGLEEAAAGQTLPHTLQAPRWSLGWVSLDRRGQRCRDTVCPGPSQAQGPLFPRWGLGWQQDLPPGPRAPEGARPTESHARAEPVPCSCCPAPSVPTGALPETRGSVPWPLPLHRGHSRINQAAWQ